MTALWSKAQIRTEARKLAGRPSTSNPTDPQLDDRIDRFIRFKLPAEVKFQLTRRFYEYTTVSGTSVITFPKDFHSFESTAFVDDDPLNVFYDPAQFWDRWSINTTETSSKPQDILIYNNDIVFRPIPDDSYSVRILGNKRLDKFATGSPSGSGDGLEQVDGQEGWGEVIAYGVAMDLLVAGGEFDKAAALKPFYDRVRALAQDATVQMLVTKRAVPIF